MKWLGVKRKRGLGLCTQACRATGINAIIALVEKCETLRFSVTGQSWLICLFACGPHMRSEKIRAQGVKTSSP